MHTIFVAQRTHKTARVPRNGLRLAVHGLASWATAVRNRHRTRRILGRLDDAALKDVGLGRSQIDGVESDPRYLPRF